MNMIRFWLGDCVMRCDAGMDTLECTDGICMLDADEAVLNSCSLYVGTPEVMEQLLAQDKIGPAGAFVVTCAGSPIQPPLPRQLTLIQTTLPLSALYNRIHAQVHRHSVWRNRLQQAVFNSTSLQGIVDIAAEELEATITVTNPGYKFIAGYFHPDIQDEVSLELMQNGYHTYEMIQKIFQEKLIYTSPDQSTMEFLASFSGLYHCVRYIRYRSILVARLVIMLNGPTPDPYYMDLCQLVSECIANAVLSNQGIDYSGNVELSSLVSDLIEGRLYNPEELNQRLKQVQLTVRRSYHLILVRIHNSSDQGLFPWNYITGQLQQAFRHCDAVIYRGDILLLARKTQRGSRPSFNQELLQQILEQYDGRAVIGNASEHLSSMAPMYNQCKGAMRIATKMDPDRRIYFFEEYSIYQIIEMAADSEFNHLSSRNLVHLCNNELIALVLYDKKNDTNLTDMLFVYLTHERNMTLTANVMYMHRNTLLYKIRKIEEIIGCSLDDPSLRERFLFSYRVMTYMEKYLGDDILKLRQPDNMDSSRPASLQEAPF